MSELRLRFTFWFYRKLKHWQLAVGDIELLCPSCGCNIGVAELVSCECDKLACMDCSVVGEDCTLCPACTQAFKNEEQSKA